MPKKRAAVIIGVNRTGGLPPLEGCISGARAVADWLTVEGFEVTLLVDIDKRPVTCSMVAAAIAKYVRSGTYHQLVVFFSGHGYWKNENELWLLSKAPGDANEAISWSETVEYAKDCGIPNVVLISDACRSLPKTKLAARVRGSVVFPNEEHVGARSKVDKFLAAAVATAAYEIQIRPGTERTSVFTHCLLDVFRAPDPDAIHRVIEDGKQITVVSNRKLGVSLQRRVPRMLALVNPTLEQEPDAEILSDENAYIARAENPPAERFHLDSALSPVIKLRDVASMAVQRELGRQPSLPSSMRRAIRNVAKETGFEEAVEHAAQLADVSRFETETGFAIIGDEVSKVAASQGNKVHLRRRPNESEPHLIQAELSGRACSVALQFANGSGTVLAALRGFIAHVTLEGTAVTNVSYVPSDNSERWNDYSARRDNIERLRATAAAAARKGVFRLDHAEKATNFAEAARVQKGLDPSLGLYAAYAYSEADNREAIESVRRLMEQDLRVAFFDVALLARRPSKRKRAFPPAVPFCPVLTQGWNLLRAKGVKLDEILDAAQDHLQPALWTTFKSKVMGDIFRAVKIGRLR